MKQKIKPSIDLGLAVLDVVIPPGITLTEREIADVCECSRTTINTICARAIAKVKTNLGSSRLQDFLVD